MTQQSLSAEAEVSTRHLSYLENGRAKPSREMVALLAEVLELPPLHRNEMLLAAGLAPQHPSTDIDDASAAHVRAAVEFLLTRHHPYPAMVVDEGWNVVMANDAYLQLACHLQGQPAPPPQATEIHRGAPVRGSNPLLSVFEDEWLRSRVKNLSQFATMALEHVRQVARTSPKARDLELRIRRAVGPVAVNTHPLPLVIPLCLDVDGEPLTLFSTMTMLGTSADIVLSSLRLETQFPADERSDRLLRRITGSGD